MIAGPLAAAAQPTIPAARRPAAYMADVAPPGLPPLRLYAEEHGQGRPLLLLHGFGGSGYSWRRIIPTLATTNRVITLDLKGFGRSDKPLDHGYSAAHQAAYVNAYIERRGLSGLTLVGHSFGGAVALIAALEQNGRGSGRISRLILLNAAAYPQQMTPKIAFLRQPLLPELALALIPPEIPTGIALSTEHRGYRHITPSDVREYARPLYDAGGQHALIQTARQIVPQNFAALIARYPSIRQPALVVSCANDTVVPLSSGYRLAKALPRARHRIIGDCDHVPSEETPGELLELMTGYLRD